MDNVGAIVPYQPDRGLQIARPGQGAVSARISSQGSEISEAKYQRIWGACSRELDTVLKEYQPELKARGGVRLKLYRDDVGMFSASILSRNAGADLPMAVAAPLYQRTNELLQKMWRAMQGEEVLGLDLEEESTEEALRAELNEVKDRVAYLEGKNQNLKVTRDRLHAHIDNLQSELDGVRSRDGGVEELEEQLEEAMQDLIVAEKERESLTSSLKEAKDLNHRLGSHLSRNSNEFDELQKNLSKERNNSKAEIRRLEGEIMELQASADSLNGQVNNLRSTNESKDGEIEELSNKIKDLETELKAKRAKIDDLALEVVFSKEELDQKQKEIDLVKAENRLLDSLYEGQKLSNQRLSETLRKT
jgi:chromosome segregation ATPase